MATITRVTGYPVPVANSDMESAPIRNQISNIVTFLEATNIDENNVDYSGTDGIVVMGQAQTVTSLKTWENTSVAAGGVRTVANFSLNPSSGTATDADGLRVAILGDDDGGTQTTMAAIDFVFTDTGASSEDCRIDFYVITAASLASELQLSGASLNPTSNDGLTLGTTALGFADLFLATGGVINWNNGEVTITETDANTLTIAGVATRLDLAAGILELNNAVEWDTGVAVVATEYSIGRDADATNQLHLNVPTGATLELSVNDVAQAVLSTTALSLAPTTLSFDAASTIDTSGNASLTINPGSAHLINSGTGMTILNDTTNAKMVLGFLVNQGANVTEAVALKNTGVAHGMTDAAETDTYATFKIGDSTPGGGLTITGLTDTDAAAHGAVVINGFLGEACDTTHTAAGHGIIRIDAEIKNGTTTQACTTNGNLLTVENFATTAFIVDAEGDLFADGVLAAYDEYDDVALISAFARVEALSGAKGWIEQEWEKGLAYDEDTLIELGLLGGKRVGVPRNQRGLINYTGFVRAHNGTIRQVYGEVFEQGKRLAQLENTLKLLEERYGPAM